MERSIRYSFQPGPSQLHPRVGYWIEVALREGLLSRYHRDSVWKGLFARAQRAVVEYLALPEGWVVTFISSATEAWQILADATASLRSLHIVQGEFGRRWFSFQQALSPSAPGISLDMKVPWAKWIATLPHTYSSVEYIAAVHVETSVGGWLPDLVLLRQAFPEAIIAIDATSSLGGINLPWEAIDVAFASLQKCFGLPAGAALLLVSPRIAESYRHYPRQRYNSLGYLIEKAQTHEPTHTPSLLHIFLLERLLPELPTLQKVERHLLKRAEWLYIAMESMGFMPLLPLEYRSPTVLALRWGLAMEIDRFYQRAEADGLYVGRGYGAYRNTSFRIANFPAVPDEAYHELIAALGQLRQLEGQ